ncbi:MAG: CBS domain-containing protein [Chloroflexota bacterium]
MKHALVQHWMTSPVITCDPATRLHDALRIMNRHQIRAMPIVEQGRLVGIVTKRDLLRADVTPVIRDSWEQYRMAGNLTMEKIMTTGVITTRPDVPAAKAARVLMENKITALPVLDRQQALVGILTASDLFRLIIEEVPLLGENIRVHEYMTADVQTAEPTTTLLAAQRMMAVKRIRALPVLQNGLLIGIVTRTDLLSAAPSVVTTQGRLEVTEMVLNTPLQFIMTTKPITIGEEQPITEAARLMLENKIHALPVLDSDQDLCGIITETDLFRLIVHKFLG